MNSENRLLNFLKGIGCIGVIFIHAELPGRIGIVIRMLAGFAVPLFFLISGYYAFDKSINAINIKKVKRRSKRILHISLSAIVIYFIFTIIRLFCLGGVQKIVNWIYEEITLKNLFKMIFLNNLDFIWAWHLWFLIALLLGYSVLYIYGKYCNSNWIFILIPICWGIRMFACRGGTLYVNNVFTTGLPFLLMGVFISKNEAAIRRINKTVWMFNTILGGVGTLFIAKFVESDIGWQFLGTILMSLSLFIIGLLYPQKHINKIIEIIGKKYSLYVYIMHLMIIIILNDIYVKMGADSLLLIKYINPFLVTAISIIVSVLIKNIAIKNVHFDKSHITMIK